MLARCALVSDGPVSDVLVSELLVSEVEDLRRVGAIQALTGQEFGSAARAMTHEVTRALVNKRSRRAGTSIRRGGAGPGGRRPIVGWRRGWPGPSRALRSWRPSVFSGGAAVD